MRLLCSPMSRFDWNRAGMQQVRYIYILQLKIYMYLYRASLLRYLQFCR